MCKITNKKEKNNNENKNMTFDDFAGYNPDDKTAEEIENDNELSNETDNNDDEEDLFYNRDYCYGCDKGEQQLFITGWKLLINSLNKIWISQLNYLLL